MLPQYPITLSLALGQIIGKHTGENNDTYEIVLCKYREKYPETEYFKQRNVIDSHSLCETGCHVTAEIF
jgi:hypothetical protein